MIINNRVSSWVNDLGIISREIWESRELFGVFAWRDIKVRYKQTLLGVSWVLGQPIISTFVFTIFFGKLAKIPSDGLPYSLFVLSGIVFWNFFSNSLLRVSDSIVANEAIIKKVYFPRIVLPVSAILTSLVDFLISFVVLILYSIFLGYPPRIGALYVFPLMIMFTAFSALGIGLFLASLNVVYRDVRYALPYFLQILMFVAPVIYPLSIVGVGNRGLMAVNPMTTVVAWIRSEFMPSATGIEPKLALISVVVSIFFFVIGVYYFRRAQKIFADIV